MTCASQPLTALLLVSYIVPCHSPMDTAKYYRTIRLAAGFQKRSATPASYQIVWHLGWY